MTYEKSCGFIAYQLRNNTREYLVLQSLNGDFGLSNCQVEKDETEYETALRELKEETNVDVEIVEGFRKQIEYLMSSKKDVIKIAVYFLGKCTSNTIICQENEALGALFLPIEKALSVLSFEETRNILKEADCYLNSINA